MAPPKSNPRTQYTPQQQQNQPPLGYPDPGSDGFSMQGRGRGRGIAAASPRPFNTLSEPFRPSNALGRGFGSARNGLIPGSPAANAMYGGKPGTRVTGYSFPSYFQEQRKAQQGPQPQQQPPTRGGRPAPLGARAGPRVRPLPQPVPMEEAEEEGYYNDEGGFEQPGQPANMASRLMNKLRGNKGMNAANVSASQPPPQPENEEEEEEEDGEAEKSDDDDDDDEDNGEEEGDEEGSGEVEGDGIPPDMVPIPVDPNGDLVKELPLSLSRIYSGAWSLKKLFIEDEAFLRGKGMTIAQLNVEQPIRVTLKQLEALMSESYKSAEAIVCKSASVAALPAMICTANIRCQTEQIQGRSSRPTSSAW